MKITQCSNWEQIKTSFQHWDYGHTYKHCWHEKLITKVLQNFLIKQKLFQPYYFIEVLFFFFFSIPHRQSNLLLSLHLYVKKMDCGWHLALHIKILKLVKYSFWIQRERIYFGYIHICLDVFSEQKCKVSEDTDI